jgi:hypothetical protein
MDLPGGAAPGTAGEGQMGQVLNGRYELETRVGDGGMAVVYQGRDRVLNRTVAIKVCATNSLVMPGF